MVTQVLDGRSSIRRNQSLCASNCSCCRMDWTRFCKLLTAPVLLDLSEIPICCLIVCCILFHCVFWRNPNMGFFVNPRRRAGLKIVLAQTDGSVYLQNLF